MIKRLNPTSTLIRDAKSANVLEQASRSPSGEFTLRWLDTVEALEEISVAWEALLEQSLVPNMGFSPTFLIPAFKHLSNCDTQVIVVESKSDDPRADAPVLCGLIPVVRKSIFHLPIPGLQIWHHNQAFDATPLVRHDCAAEVLTFLLQQLAEQKFGLLEWGMFSAEPAFEVAFTQAVEAAGVSKFQKESFSRAALRPAATFDDYRRQHVSKSIQRNHRRLARRLEEQGDVRFEISDQNSNFAILAQEFLEIETRGWKGEAGTALACNPAEKAFYLDLISRAADAGQARFVTLRLDGKPIAMLSDLQFDGVVYSYKTTFDDAFSAYSPGLQAELKNIEFMHERRIEIADSCTASDNNTINRIWGQELKFQSVVLGLKPGIAQIATRMMPTAQATIRGLKSLRKS